MLQHPTNPYLFMTHSNPYLFMTHSNPYVFMTHSNPYVLITLSLFNCLYQQSQLFVNCLYQQSQFSLIVYIFTIYGIHYHYLHKT